MNAGLSNFATLKGHLLGEELLTETKFDSQILTLGLGVAAAFDGFCNRRLGWNAEDVITFSAHREHFALPRYPIVDVSLVETRGSLSEEWEEDDTQPYQVNYENGIVDFGGTLGYSPAQARVTWSGGYWFDEKDPDEEGYPTAKPTGSVAMPADLKLAFLTQCAAVWAARDKLGTAMIEKPAAVPAVELQPMVKTILDKYTRYALT